MNEDYGVKHIYELPLNNDVAEADSFPFDQGNSGNTYRAQFRGIIDLLLRNYLASKDLTNLTDETVADFISRLSVPDSPDTGTGLVLRTHSNETQAGLRTLSEKLISAQAHLIADMFFENLTSAEFLKLQQLFSNAVKRTSTDAYEGILANRDLTNLTETGITNLNRVNYVELQQTSQTITIPATALNRCVRIRLNQDVASIILPTSGLSNTMLNQVIIMIDRNGHNIASGAFTGNGYTLRGTGATMPSFTATFDKDKAIEFFCEYDDFTNTANPTWNYGYSKIGH